MGVEKVEKVKDDTRPLVVCDETGAFLFLSSINSKGYAKSIERSALWTTHPDTDKILPSGRETKLKTIQDRNDYYYAEVILENEVSVIAEQPVGNKKEKSSARKTGPVVLDPKILSDLIDLISRRKSEMPEGSYTTYLFNEGVEKIRKKTGEESIELILANKKEDIIYEAADLVYHMLVLLEAEEISFAAVLDELKSRK